MAHPTPATHHPTPTTPAAQEAAAAGPPVELSFEDRLTLIDAAMTVRLEEAGVAYEVNAAHIHTEPVDLADIVTPVDTRPVDTGPAPLPDLYPTPVAALLQRAHHRLLTGGWCTGTLVNEQGARCLWGAIHAETGGNPALEADALHVLLDAIQRRFGPVDSVAAFNDAWGNPSVPLRILGQAAGLADARGI